jgi:pimeloyl-ACP methyl ester carboxylesterase
MAWDDRRPVEIRSPLDGSIQHGMLSLPASPTDGPLPLILAPHPFGWSVEEDYHGGCVGLQAAEHRGWRGVPSELGVAVIQPDGHHRAVERCSLGYEGVWVDAPAWLAATDAIVPVDRSRVYACGLSMGGQESLLIAGHQPGMIAAVFVFNPVVDAAAWHDDLARTPSAALRAEGSERLIAEEVGGTPADAPAAYARRSAFSVLPALTAIPISIWWSPLDLVVPRQAECHGKRLFDELRRLDPNAPVTEHDHTSQHRLSDPPTERECWGIHETSDYASAARWLLRHRRA